MEVLVFISPTSVECVLGVCAVCVCDCFLPTMDSTAYGVYEWDELLLRHLDQLREKMVVTYWAGAQHPSHIQYEAQVILSGLGACGGL